MGKVRPCALVLLLSPAAAPDAGAYTVGMAALAEIAIVGAPAQYDLLGA